MRLIPRIGLGVTQAGQDSQPATWAVLDVLATAGVQPQHFLSRACFAPHDAAPTLTGLGTRHLDSWLMTPEVCREVFSRAGAKAEFGVVEGSFEDEPPRGGRLDLLCDWLRMPRVAIVDAAQFSACRVPAKPAECDAILFDRVPEAACFSRLQTVCESLWGVPVLGGVEELPNLRGELAVLPRGAAPSLDMCRALGQSLHRTLRHDKLIALAACNEMPGCEGNAPSRPMADVRIAVAFDAAFRCYFPDTLDLLELRGATLVDFSPLKDESLPPDVDIVYLGCGHPERFAAELAGNLCMSTALRNHVCAGRRIYAEGGGLAYLCRQIETPDGDRLPMVGAVPAIAKLNPRPTSPSPAEVRLSRDSWLGEAGAALRGYLNSTWRLEPTGDLIDYGCGDSPGEGEFNIVGRHHIVGSRLHLNFAALPQAMRGFLRPHAPSLACCHAAGATSRKRDG